MKKFVIVHLQVPDHCPGASINHGDKFVKDDLVSIGI